MNRMLFAATALGLAFGGSVAFGASTAATDDGYKWQDDQASYDFKAPMDVTCKDFVGASAAYQDHVVAWLEGRAEGIGERDEMGVSSAQKANGANAPVENELAVNSGADVAEGTRGVENKSGLASMTMRGTASGTYRPVSVPAVAQACSASPDLLVSGVVDEQISSMQ